MDREFSFNDYNIDPSSLVFGEGLAVVRVGNLYNYVDIDRHLLSDEWFCGVWPFRNGYAKVLRKNGYNIINGVGEICLEGDVKSLRLKYCGGGVMKIIADGIKDYLVDGESVMGMTVSRGVADDGTEYAILSKSFETDKFPETECRYNIFSREKLLMEKWSSDPILFHGDYAIINNTLFYNVIKVGRKPALMFKKWKRSITSLESVGGGGDSSCYFVEGKDSSSVYRQGDKEPLIDGSRYEMLRLSSVKSFFIVLKSGGMYYFLTVENGIVRQLCPSRYTGYCILGDYIYVTCEDGSKKTIDGGTWEYVEGKSFGSELLDGVHEYFIIEQDGKKNIVKAEEWEPLIYNWCDKIEMDGKTVKGTINGDTFYISDIDEYYNGLAEIKEATINVPVKKKEECESKRVLYFDIFVIVVGVAFYLAIAMLCDIKLLWGAVVFLILYFIISKRA